MIKYELDLKMPQWYKEISEINGLILSNDLDSLISCNYLKEKFNCNVIGFYSFNELYSNGLHFKEAIGVDIDFCRSKCFGNHAIPKEIKNTNCVNLNNTITLDGGNYTKKFAGSTIVMLMALYNDFNNLNEEQIKLLMCIDSGYKQYYKYRKQFDVWYKKLGIYDKVVNVLKQYTLEEMQEYSIDLGINVGIVMIDDTLAYDKEFDIEKISNILSYDLVLPVDKFSLFMEFNTKSCLTSDFKHHYNKETIISCARTYKDSVRFTYN